MSALLILQDLQARGFVLALAGEGIKVTPSSALTDADRQAIRLNKHSIRSHLRRMQTLDPADPLVVTLMPAERWIADLVEAGQLRVRADGLPMPVQKFRLPGPDANPPIRKPIDPPLASLAGIPLEDMTPPEHWAAIDGELVRAIDSRLWARLRLTVVLYQRDGPGVGPWEQEYAAYWRQFTTGEMA
jgi:hypothetical protein